MNSLPRSGLLAVSVAVLLAGGAAVLPDARTAEAALTHPAPMQEEDLDGTDSFYLEERLGNAATGEAGKARRMPGAFIGKGELKRGRGSASVFEIQNRKHLINKRPGKGVSGNGPVR